MEIQNVILFTIFLRKLFLNDNKSKLPASMVYQLVMAPKFGKFTAFN